MTMQIDQIISALETFLRVFQYLLGIFVVAVEQRLPNFFYFCLDLHQSCNILQQSFGRMYYKKIHD